jgi:hypothetical protein
MAKTYNTVKTDTIVNEEDDRAFLDGLASCVCLTPAEEERILPSRKDPDPEGKTHAPENDEYLDDYDDDLPDLDDIDPTDEDLEDEEVTDQQLIHDLLASDDQ